MKVEEAEFLGGRFDGDVMLIQGMPLAIDFPCRRSDRRERVAKCYSMRYFRVEPNNNSRRVVYRWNGKYILVWPPD